MANTAAERLQAVQATMVALRIQGVAGASDTTWDNITQDVAS